MNQKIMAATTFKLLPAMSQKDAKREKWCHQPRDDSHTNECNSNHCLIQIPKKCLHGPIQFGEENERFRFDMHDFANDKG